MSPRAYRSAGRREAAERTRERILRACRELLGARSTAASFSVDAVARRAGVARMTVYYQFESKRGLLESLYDHLARRGGLERLPEAFLDPDPSQALDAYIAFFGRFWSRDRIVVRRIRALAVLDRDVAAVLERDRWRAGGLSVLLKRLQPDKPDDGLAAAVAAVHMLTSFEAFDALAGSDKAPEDVIPLVRVLVWAALDAPLP